MVSRRALAPAIAAVASAGALAGCTLLTDSFLTNDFSGDPSPVNVDTSSGALVVDVRPTGGRDTVAVLDLLSPLTTIDPEDPLAPPEATTTDLTLLGAATPTSALTPDVGWIQDGNLVARANFRDSQLISLHACDSSEANASGRCHIGTADPAVATGASPPPPVEFRSVLGADTLAGDAIRLRLADRQIFVLPDVAGSAHQRSLDCDAFFGSPYRGGGTLVISGTETSFGNRRIALGACLGPHPERTPQVNRGTDALLVVSTAIGISIIGQSAYTRYQAGHPPPAGAPAPDPADHTVYLPSGLVHGHLGSLDGLSLVAAPAGNQLSPCRQIYAHRILEHGPASATLCPNDHATSGDCPCGGTTTSCNVPAVLELKPAIPVLVVDDTDPTLQALRTELRPDQPEVDGILGTAALANAEFDIDYPHDRVLARCRGASCCARPQLVDTTAEQFAQINRCITAQAACPTDSVDPTAGK